MLYTYKHFSHDFDLLHEYLTHTVLNVWCKPHRPFSINLLHKNFQPMVLAVSKHQNDYLLRPIKTIYNRFKHLKPSDIAKIRNGFHNNNAIESLCNGSLQPLLFKELKIIDSKLHNDLQKFGKNLYMHLTTIQACIKYSGDLTDHYKELVRKNNSELCPFCGLNDIKSHRLSKRDAFDHFFSKDKYPFSSVNPLNLAPMCDDCNSSYKGQYDPIHDVKGARRKIFYPFSKGQHTVNIKMKIKTPSISKLSMNDLEFTFSCKGKGEEVQSWVTLFGLDERYKDKCCKDKDGHAWYRKVVDDCRNYGISPQEMYKIELETAKLRRLSDNNFLRVPFLKACNDIGIIK